MRFAERFGGWLAVALLGLGLGFAGDAFAQAEACKDDVAKFCSSVQPGGQRVVQCLNKNKGQLSAPCKARMAKMEQQLKGVGQACADDVHTLCAGVHSGGGRIAACLKQHEDKVSTECKSKIGEAKQKK